MKENGWKIGLLIVLFGAAGWFAWRGYDSTRVGKNIPDRDTYVDVATGETFVLARTNPMHFPRTNPNTGQPTLVPIYLESDGKYYLSERLEYLLEDETIAAQNQCIDPESRQVKSDHLSD